MTGESRVLEGKGDETGVGRGLEYRVRPPVARRRGTGVPLGRLVPLTPPLTDDVHTQYLVARNKSYSAHRY